MEHHHQTYIFALLTEERLAWYLFDFSLYIVFCTKRTHQRQLQTGSFDHWCFPCTGGKTGLNCYNVTSGSTICNNVTSSFAMQVCKHGFTNLVSNVMTKWYFESYNHQCFHVQINFNMTHEIFQWLPLIFNDFSRQNVIFPGQHKIPWLFKSRVKFHDFSRPVRTMLCWVTC